MEDGLISEGGYGFVYKVHFIKDKNDEKKNEKEYFAIKKMIVLDRDEQMERVIKEINLW